MTDEGIISVYTEELIALSETARAPQRLQNPDASARAISPVCGSAVTIDLNVENGKITAIGFESDSCALTRAVLAVMNTEAIAKTQAEIQAAGTALQCLLAGQESALAGGFTRLGLLTPVRDYPARHNAILLPFEAVEKAFQKL
jgi:NifU-like protein involved in Fe-S cluster formation